MKHIFAIFATIIVLAGCSNERPVNAVLLGAERIVEDRPDSAIDMIYRERDTLLHSTADTALYNLLYIESLHLSGVNLYDTAMLDYSERFYTHDGDKQRLARTKAHYGMMLMHRRHMIEAAQKMKEAEELADATGNATVRYVIHNALGDLNRLANCQSLMILYYKKAIADAQEMKDNDRKAAVLNKLAAVYRRAGDRAMFRKYVKRCRPLLPYLRPETKSNVLASFGTVELIDGRRQKAHEYLDSALQVLPNEYATLLLGDIFQMEGNQERAVDLWFEATNTLDADIYIAACQRLVSHFNKIGNYRTAYNMSHRMNVAYKGLNKTDRTVEVAKLQADYDKTREQRTLHHRLMLLACAIVTLLVAILAFILYHRRKTHRYMDIIHSLNDKFKVTQSQKKQMLLNAEMVYHLHKNATTGKAATDEDWRNVVELMQQNAPNFLESLYQKGNLTDKERNICTLIKLRFQPSEIATLTNSSPQSVTNIRQRLLQRLFEESGGAKEFDRKIMEL